MAKPKSNAKRVKRLEWSIPKQRTEEEVFNVRKKIETIKNTARK